MIMLLYRKMVFGGEGWDADVDVDLSEPPILVIMYPHCTSNT